MVSLAEPFTKGRRGEIFQCLCQFNFETLNKSRFEDALKYYDFKSKGFEIMIDQICFPIHGTDTMDLIRKSLGEEPA